MRISHWCMLGLALCGLLVAQGPARADNIDQGLFGKAESLLKYLRDHKYKNVGVLRFEVKKGKSPATMAAGQLNSLMATRLENALIYVSDLTDPIGITRGASAVAAAKDRGANIHTPAGRQGLFKHDYPLAWGTQQVKVDAFVTGRVEISEDFTQTKIILQCFDKKDAKLQDIGQPIMVKTDRSILRDMGQTFVITKRSLNLKARDGVIDSEELDQEAVKDVQQDNKQPDNSDPTNKNPQQPPPGSNNLEQIKQYLDFQVLIDGNAAEITPHGDSGKIKMPTPDQKVTIKVNAKVRLGLLLRVNGMNTLSEQKDERPFDQYSWWILEPNKDYTIRGFYNSGAVKLFRVLAKADVDVSELGDNQERHGRIEFDVFVDKGQGVTDEPNVQVKERKTVSLRRTAGTAPSLAAAKKTLVANLNKSTTKREVFIVGRDQQAAALETTTFEGNFHIGSCKIFYNLPE